MISWSQPWLLVLLGVLPLLWWWLRHRPRPPQKIRFPAFVFLRAPQKQIAPAQSDWWIWLWRSLILALLILAAAAPQLPPVKELSLAPHVVVLVDNGWAAAKNWSQMDQSLKNILRKNPDKQFLLLPTNQESEDQGKKEFLSASEALAWWPQIHPLPTANHWQKKEKDFAKILGQADQILFLSSGIVASGEKENLLNLLRPFQGIVLTPQPAKLPLILRDVDLRQKEMTVESPTSQKTVLYSADQTGKVQKSKALDLTKGPQKIAVDFLPQAGVSALRLEGENHLAGTFFLDSRQKIYRLGLLKNWGPQDQILDQNFYLQNAAEGKVEIMEASLDDLLAQDLSLMILPDTKLPADAQTRLENWAEKGGVILRIPHDKENARQDLRHFRQGLKQEGAMKVLPFESSSPFYGLVIPDDLEVYQQVLSSAQYEATQDIWARLSDQTPLITARKIGKGYELRFAVALLPSWSNLPLSPVWLGMVERLIHLSSAAHIGELQMNENDLWLKARINAWGEWEPSLAQIPYQTPPQIAGRYGKGAAEIIVNGGAILPSYDLFKAPLSWDMSFYEAQDMGTEFWPWLFMIAGGMILLDALFFGRWFLFKRFWMLLPLFFLMTPLAQAAEVAIDQIDLPYIQTQDNARNRLQENGLNSLAHLITLRTTIPVGKAVAVDPAKEEINYYPILFWAPDAQDVYDEKFWQSLDRYLARDGVLVIDGFRLSADNLENLARQLMGLATIGGNLVPLTADHVLARCFYLLDQFPGQRDTGQVWAEPMQAINQEDISNLVIGQKNWFGAWARDAENRPLYPLIPGGEAQRVLAERFGINLVIYALTGHYKQDQVHVKTILERRRQGGAP